MIISSFYMAPFSVQATYLEDETELQNDRAYFLPRKLQLPVVLIKKRAEANPETARLQCLFDRLDERNHIGSCVEEVTRNDAVPLVWTLTVNDVKVTGSDCQVLQRFA